MTKTAVGKITWKEEFKRNWKVYAILLIPASYFLVFKYLPMAGIVIAFQDYKATAGIFGSEWIGFMNFTELFSGGHFLTVLRNTSVMAFLNLTLGFFAPVALGIMILQLRNKRFSQVSQTVIYIPYFISAAVVCSLAREFLSDSGAVTRFLMLFGLEEKNWLANNGPSFWLINTFMGIWQGAGHGAIIYITAIHGISRDLYEAAGIDGAGRWKQLIYVTLPGLLPVIAMLFILQMGVVFIVGFDKVLLLYMPSTYEYSDVLMSYTYRMAFGSSNNFGLSAASGLLQSVIGTILIIVGNKIFLAQPLRNE